MPDAPKKFAHPLDQILGPPDTGSFEHVDSSKPAQAVADAGATPDLVPPAPETPPAPDAPATDAPATDAPASDAPPPASDAPREAATEGEEGAPEGESEKRPRRPRWDDVREADKRARESERRALELERENSALRTRMTMPEPPRVDPDAPPAEPEDPLTVLEKRQARLEEENRSLQAQVSQRHTESQIKAQEDAYRREHPEYDDVFKFFLKAERDEAEEAGFLDDASAHLRQTQRQLVLNVALNRNIGEDEAAKEIAFSAMIQARRDAIVAASRRTGRAIPDIVVAMAKRRGYSGAGAGASVTVENTGAPANGNENGAKPALPKPSPADIKNASTSLSNVTRSPAPPEITEPKTRRDMLSHLASLTLTERDKYLEKLDRENPKWAEGLA